MASNIRRSVDLLPAYFRTEKNNKFLSSTLDQFLSVPELTRIDAYVGSKNTPNYSPDDRYIEDSNKLRQAYQLEPGLVVKTLTQEIKKAFGLDDLLNRVDSLGGNSSNIDRTLHPKFYSYDPKIDWDKFINFREYFWLPTGPGTITISGQKKGVLTEFNVTDAEDGIQFLFDGRTTSQHIVLYRGSTYVFNVKSAHKFYIKYTNTVGSDNLFDLDITGNGTQDGQIVIKVTGQTPEYLYYTSSDNQLATGPIYVKDPEENSSIDVETEILGKASYTSASGVKFINGLKIKFTGTVFPEQYRDVEFIVDGVGKSINLIKFSSLETPDIVADLYNTRFDGTNFDQFPFDNFSNIPLVPEYVTISKASKDLNPWTRYNRWFHSDVIRAVAEVNGSIPVYPAEYRASRPIVEFHPNIQLFNFGMEALPNVDLIDTTTKNVFLKIENQPGFYIDNILVEAGYRIIFTNDPDPLVRGKIFRVQFSVINGVSKIDLVKEDDLVNTGSCVLVKYGKENGGKSWWFDGTNWVLAQQRTSRNQSPLFDLFDSEGNNFSDKNYVTDFAGNKIFGYGIGTGTNDPILGFPLLYRNVGVEGTYLFKNYFATEEFLVVKNTVSSYIPTASTYFKIDGKLTNIWSDTVDYSIPLIDGAYDVPLNLTNNPLNDPITDFTLTELSNHVESMVERSPDFVGTFPGVSNLKDLPYISQYGTKLISNLNSLAFAQHFISDEDNNLISAVRLVGENYYQFKLNFIKTIGLVDQTLSPVDAVDAALQILNQNKTTTFPYYYSDMLPHGTGSIVRNYVVTDSRNVKYAIPAEFSLSKLSNTGVLVYHNDTQLLAGSEYTVDVIDNNVSLKINLARNDVITIKYYSNTNGSFIPPTPSKLGLYPKFEPVVYLDDTFALEPRNVLQGHDGSLTLLFDDYRDDILLEFERRIFNNIKVEYRQDLLDINSILPSAFRNQEFSYNEIFNPVHQDFLKWKTTYGVETDENLTFDISLPRTFNYSEVVVNGSNLPGNWRPIFKMYFDTDRPHIAPWEMLGFSVKPEWWEDEYGPAPYTSGNTMLWDDLEAGRIKQGPRAGLDPLYARPGLSKILPVNESGELVDIRYWGPVGVSTYLDTADRGWKFGDCGPGETSWRRSSYWPFAVQVILALAKPATYAALMFDTSRIVKNAVGQYVYSEDNLFVNQARVLLPYESVDNSVVLTAGYSVFVIEAGRIKNTKYLSSLSEDLKNSTFNLIHKVGGFVSKDKLEIVIDSVNPNSVNPGILLPVEDYTIHFNVSNPVKIVNLSGFIIQKLQGRFIVRGYDKVNPYFTTYPAIHEKNDTYISVGGKSEDYVVWSQNAYYPIGQVILYENSFYRVTNNHNSGLSFNPLNYSILSDLPIINATVVAYPSFFETTPVEIPYGTSYGSLQEVADVMAGYGKWLEDQGFTFDEFNTDINEVLNWKFAIKEFAYWSSQNWADNSVIAVSPFANEIKFTFQDSVVDDVFSSFYDYSLLKADGFSFPPVDLSISRANGECTIKSKNDQEGIYFASLRLVQKEHAIILNNTSRFNDVIYDIDTGYRQRRIRLIGFKTANWNGDYFSPGFVYDSANVKTWKSYEDYYAGDVVEYAGSYYSLDRNLSGKERFDFTDWNKLGSKPVAQLIPNFEYKINQFEDFYSLEIDNFDLSQQQLAQHLTGYSSRVYLNNIFFNQIAQYKFFQGFIKEKGTRNALEKLAKASVHNLQGTLDFNEEWAFRIGTFGAYASLQEIEFPLSETKFVDNSQLVKFVDTAPVLDYDSTLYITSTDLSIRPIDYQTSSTFYTKTALFESNPFNMPIAGYVRLEDVDYAVKTKEDLFSFIPGKTVKQGDIFWIAYDNNKDWGVYRYTRMPSAIIEVADNVPGESITFKTNVYHGLAVGDIIAVTRFADEVNGIYIISEVNRLNEFVVKTTNQAPGSTNDFGVLFKFVSSRFEKFDDLADTKYVADIYPGRKIWVDSNLDGNWEVYEKIDNYDASVIRNRILYNGSYYGESIVSKEDSNVLLVSAPRLVDDNGSGQVFIYLNNNGTMKFINSYPLNKGLNQLYENGSTPPAKFGFSLDLDSADNIFVAGAPYAWNVKADTEGATRYVRPTNSGIGNTNEGLIVLSTLNAAGNAELRHEVIACQEPAHNLEFGYSVFIGSTATNKILLVGAPGHTDSTGAVFSYDVAYYKSFDNLTIEVNATATTQIKLPTESIGISAGSRFGDVIAGDLTGKRVAVSAPGYDNSKGAVFIYSNTGTSSTYDFVQTLAWNDASLNGAISSNGQFGYDIDMDDSGKYLFISAFNAFDKVLQRGKVVVYEWTGTQYSALQVIDNPSTTNGLKFGFSVESDSSGNILTITSQGPNYFANASFDNGTTSFDSESTRIGSLIEDSGSAYVYNRYQNKFIFANELYNNDILPNSSYGYSVSVNRDNIYISAPRFISTGTLQTGAIHLWQAKDPNSNSWNLLRQQSELVDVEKIKQVKTINVFNESVADYLEIYDPVKGRIPLAADRELRYKTFFDPAVYNTGTNKTVTVDMQTQWGPDQVGELWWDLSSVKYVWYEQGDVEYRKNAWGTVFPGCTIDVYEWVRSDFLPSQWVLDADTPAGLAENISGTPKYVDNSAYVVEEVYSPITDTYVNAYYFWVKNTVIVPDRQGRSISAFDVAGLIENPKLFGLKYIQPLSKNSLSVVNVKGSLINERISLNIQIDDIDNETNRHTEWLLLEEGNPHSLPTPMLEKKLIDSLLGRDSLGNLVPDPTLSDRQKYGIGIRPRQSMFKDRISALRNFFEYANYIFEKNLITDFCNLDRLNSKEPIPVPSLREYDIVVEDISQRNEINLTQIKQASASCIIENGRINFVKIIDPGFGYGRLDPLTFDEDDNPITWRGPTVEVFNDTNGSVLESVVDSFGRIIEINIVNPGEGYLEIPELFIRPFTVIVSSDSDSRGRWAKYSLSGKEWNKVQTQSFDTTLYWDLVDWISSDFNQYQRLTAVVGVKADLDTLELSAGDYVKVLNNGAGRYMILKKVETGGSYNTSFDIMYSEKGTIKIKDSIWRLTSSQLGWDQVAPYDNTFWDQTADTELGNIISAFRDDIFVGNLKVYWNQLFFASVKYALTEQKFLDWAFKTSFISVHNKAGELLQRPVYKFQDSQWYEAYLNEVKPYHTKVRNYQLTYDVTEPTNTFTTDFDLPVVYNSSLDRFEVLTADDAITKTDYPYKGWYDNRTLTVESIEVDYSGSGYTEVPVVEIIPAAGDTVTRHAVAEALIASGKVAGFEIIDQGEGYMSTPTVLITGGGLTPAGTPARASVRLANGKVRSNKVGLKFDRISASRTITNRRYVDQFIGDGVAFQYDLSWPCYPDKTEITVRVNGIPVASSSYEIEDYTGNANGYTQTYTRLVLSSVPATGSIIKINYLKSLEIYSAYDRVANYFDEVPLNSPGANADEKYAQLMKGMEYPGTEIKTADLWYDFTWDSSPYGTVRWDKESFNTSDLDTMIDGGTVTTSTNNVFSVASGLNPEDIILDGDSFISPYRSYAPEEMIPGELKEAISINVFNRVASGSATVYTQTQTANLNSDTVINMTISPPSPGSIHVTYNQKLIERTVDYIIDFVEKKITVYRKLDEPEGIITVTYMDVGGAGFISMNSAVSEGSTVAAVLGDCQYTQAKSVYVTLNGNKVLPKNSFVGQSVYYTFGPSAAGSDDRAKVTVYGLGTASKNIITAAFFTSPFKGFSEVYEQVLYNIRENLRTITVTQAPGNLGPASSNSIVELNGKRLSPPNTTYYEITNVNQLSFDISTKENYQPNTFDKTRIEVYKNGKVIIPADYYLDDYNNRITFDPGTFAIGDVLAITALIDYDYIIRGDKLTVDGRVPFPEENYIRIITFTNQDPVLIRTEVYKASATRLYKTSRKVLNDNLVWIAVGDRTLARTDFEVMSDGMTIMIDYSIPFNSQDQIIITSFAQNSAGKTVGWRQFKDMVGRTHFKRLSNSDTTYLTQPLMLTDTVIHVENGGVLPEADISARVPGIIFIAGERIEYLEKNGNVLSKIKRATMGTGAKEHYMAGTWVVDQGKTQTIPYTETLITASTVTTISTSTLAIELDTTQFTFRENIDLSNQVEVYCGGRLLQKPATIYVHDASAEYNPINMTVKAPEFTVTGTVTTATVTINVDLQENVEVKVVQRVGKIWSSFSGKPMFEQTTPQAVFINRKEAISPDQLYYGGDSVLRFDDGTALLLDDGREIKGY